MSTQATERGNVGVIGSLVTQIDGTVRLVFDDAGASTTLFPQTWTAERLFTWNDYPSSEFFEIRLTEKQLAEIGLNLVTRLVALTTHQGPKKE
jgi:hypothetical protein